jgi:hypothetical protein
MSFLRHVGKIGDRKVAIVFREVPSEDHMALVVYTESLNRHIHDPLMKCIESDIGQNSENLADALNRTHTNDGKIILQVLHKEGLLKKVQTNQVVMTPSPSTQIKLDELNKMLDEMQQGEEAIKRLAEMDESLGMQSAKQVAQRMRNKEAIKTTPPVGVPDVPGVLGDTALANNLKQQAARMEAEAKGLLAESARLHKEAAEMLGIKPETVSTSTTAPTAKKRGRPAKATVTA